MNFCLVKDGNLIIQEAVSNTNMNSHWNKFIKQLQIRSKSGISQGKNKWQTRSVQMVRLGFAIYF